MAGAADVASLLRGGGGGAAAGGLAHLTDAQLLARMRALRDQAASAFGAEAAAPLTQLIDSFPATLNKDQREEAERYLAAMEELRRRYKDSRAEVSRPGEDTARIGSHVNYTAIKAPDGSSSLIVSGSTFSDQFSKFLKIPGIASIQLLVVIGLLLLMGFNAVGKKLGFAPILDATQQDQHRRTISEAAKKKGWNVKFHKNGATFTDANGQPQDASELLEEIRNQSDRQGYRVSTDVIGAPKPTGAVLSATTAPAPTPSGAVVSVSPTGSGASTSSVSPPTGGIAGGGFAAAAGASSSASPGGSLSSPPASNPRTPGSTM